VDELAQLLHLWPGAGPAGALWAVGGPRAVDGLAQPLPFWPDAGGLNLEGCGWAGPAAALWAVDGGGPGRAHA